MSESREIYSQQTKQTRTALTLSTVTLFLFSTIAKPVAGSVKLPPGYFDFEPIWLWPLLAGAVVYFFISFFTSASYDKADGVSPNSLKIVADAKFEYVQSLEYFKQLTDKAFESVKMHGLAHKQQFQRVTDEDLSKIKHAINRLSDINQQIVPDIIEIRSRFTDTERIDKELESLRKDLDVQHSTLITHFNSFESLYEKLQASVQSISRFKHFWVEFFFPLAFAVVAIVFSFAKHGVMFYKFLFPA